jgi:hypothetical protein
VRAQDDWRPADGRTNADVLTGWDGEIAVAVQWAHASGTETLGWGDTVVYLSAGGVLDPPSPLGLVGGGGGGESLYLAKPSFVVSIAIVSSVAHTYARVNATRSFSTAAGIA